MKIDFSKYPLPKRIRHHTSPMLYLPADELKKLPRGYPPLIENISWNEHFANGEGPDVLDVGCGKGGLLLDYAEENPRENILGIEIRKSLVQWIRNFVLGENIKNASAIWYSVVNGLDFIDSGSISKIFYLFPDPWTKKRHQKRRAFSDNFLEFCYSVLKSKGELFLATDVQEVHDYHLDILSQSQKFNFREIFKDNAWPLPATNKESFCRRENITFFRIICSKKD